MQNRKRSTQFDAYGLSPAEFRARATTPAFRKRQATASMCLATARDALSGFVRGTHVFGLTKGQFSLIDLAAAALEHTGPAAVSVWTWCIADYEVQAFSAFMGDGRITSLRVVMDWAGAQRDMPLVGELQEKYGADCIRVTKTHAKIVTAVNAEWSVTIRGSMNLNANPRFEQFDVSDDPGILAVVDSVMQELWERGKPLPARQLDHAGAVALLDAGEVKQAPVSWAPPATKRWW